MLIWNQHLTVGIWSHVNVNWYVNVNAFSGMSFNCLHNINMWVNYVLSSFENPAVYKGCKVLVQKL